MTLIVLLTVAAETTDARIFGNRRSTPSNYNPRTHNWGPDPPPAPPSVCNNGNCVQPRVMVQTPRTRVIVNRAKTAPAEYGLAPTEKPVVVRRVVKPQPKVIARKEPAPKAPIEQSPGRQPSGAVSELISQIPNLEISLKTGDGEVIDTIKIDLQAHAVGRLVESN